MAYRLFAKSPVQMRREAEPRGKPRRRERRPGPLDPARRPMLDGANFAALRTRAPGVRFRVVTAKIGEVSPSAKFTKNRNAPRDFRDVRRRGLGRRERSRSLLVEIQFIDPRSIRA